MLGLSEMKYFFLICALFFSSSSIAANISMHESGNGCFFSGVFIEGNIEVGDFKKFQNVVSNLKNKYGAKRCSDGDTHVRINSKGGSVEEALLIGREIRKNSFGVIVMENSECLSSCVFILASGVSKFVNGKVGIHRPYFISIEEGKSAEEIRSMRDSLSIKIKTFLNFMDVPESLFEEMLSYPPEKIKVLSQQDLTRFRLSGKDATQDEIDTANSAKYFNLTSAEYRKRFEESFEKCNYLIKANASGESILKCVHSRIINITDVEYERRWNKANTMCLSVSSTEKLKCRKSFIVENK